MSKKKQLKICRNCELAEWQKTKTGRPSRIFFGRCLWEMSDIVFPNSLRERAFNTIAIWWEDDNECPAWKSKNG